MTTTAVTRVCATCEKEKPIEAFHRNARSLGGRLRRCGVCVNEAKALVPRDRAAANASARRYREANLQRVQETQRRSKLMLQYGITLEEYDAMLDEQGGGCAICTSTDPGHGKRHFCVDHDHETGRVRGLLCKDCNTGLGMFGDSIAALMAAANYLTDGDEG